MFNDFGAWVRGVRQQRGLTLREVAAAYGVSVPYLSDIELGKRSPPPRVKWDRFAAALGVTVEEIEARYRCPRCGK